MTSILFVYMYFQIILLKYYAITEQLIKSMDTILGMQTSSEITKLYIMDECSIV